MRETNWSPPDEITLTAAAARVRLGYNAMLGRVLRGDIQGRQDECGRWRVSAASVEDYRAAHGLSQAPANVGAT